MIRTILRYQKQLTGENFFVTLRRYFIFIAGGGIGWLLLIGLHTLLQERYGYHPAFSYGTGCIVAVIFSFVYNRFITFKIKANWQTRFIQFSILTTIISIANWGIFLIGRVILDLPVPDLIMSFFISLFLSVINFLVNRAVIFKYH